MWHCSIAEAMDRIDASDVETFDDWQAFYLLEPWGDPWRQAALIAAKCLQPYSKRYVDPEQLLEPPLFPGLRREQPQQPIDEMVAILEGAVARHNAGQK